MGLNRPPAPMGVRWPKSLAPLLPGENFTPENLSDKINGKAERCFQAGFKALKSQRLALSEDASAWMEIFIYDMGSWGVCQQECPVHGRRAMRVTAENESRGVNQALMVQGV